MRQLTAASPPRASIAIEWLLDNEHLVLRAADQTYQDLPPGFYGRLPKIEDGRQAETRVEAIAREILSVSGDFADIQQLRRFVQAYQSAATLDNGEVWALPAMLRLVVVEEVIDAARRATADDEPERQNERMATSIGSLRVLDATDWADFFESVSVVERYLRLDPSGAHARQDFRTRDRCRHAVEDLSRWSGVSEPNVARAALERAREAEKPVSAVLIGPERDALERSLGARPPLATRLRRAVRRRAGLAYFGGASAVSAGALLLGLLPMLRAIESVTPLVAALAVAAALVPAVSVAIALVNEIATRMAKPERLARLDFRERIPDDARAVVAVPALLTDPEEIRELLRQIELNHRCNASENLAFALLVDPTDAEVRERPDDGWLLEIAAEGIRALNRRADAEGGSAPFLLFARGRVWNESEGRWMGWERKRGKLEELNRLLLSGAGGTLRLVEGDRRAIEGVRYVVTIDADTLLPEGAAARLIGTLAHPLNRAGFDERGRVVTGYTVMQPRIDTVADADRPTWFSVVSQAHDGFDLYAHAVSDVYQDLFGEGIFAGKGVYDVRAFERALRDAVPENALLSHDLFEGIHGRAALVSDVAVIEEYPSHPVAHMRRLHRWVRGDWQLLPWLLPTVPTRTGRARNRLSGLDRFKILDNLRRSLLAISLVALATIGWWWLPGSWWWTMLPVVVLLVPVLVSSLASLRAPRWQEAVFGDVVARLGRAVARAITSVAFLPWQAWVESDAIVRTLYRLLVSRRNLLAWRPAAATARALAGRRGGTRLRPWIPVLLVPAAIGGVTVATSVPLTPTLPLLILWLAAPLLATSLGRQVPTGSRELPDPAPGALLRLARRTWAYFDRLLSAEDHWLAPDNLQLHPLGEVARRTSPTNIGLGMLSHVVAGDLGFVPPSRLVATLANSLDSLERMEKHRGHLLNWYDTRNLRPLSPRYVSSVDSGNLAACALVVRAALEDLAASRFPAAEHVDGVSAALEVLAETLEDFRGIGAFRKEALPSEVRSLAADIAAAREEPVTFFGRLAVLDRVGLPTVETQVAHALEEGGRPRRTGRSLGAVREWVRGVDRQVSTLHRELEVYAPWLRAVGDAPRVYRDVGNADRDVRAAWGAFVAAARTSPRLVDIPAFAAALVERLDRLEDAASGAVEPASGAETAARRWGADLRGALRTASDQATSLLADIEAVRRRLDELVDGMDFSFLYDRGRKLLRLGYHVDGATLDRSYYDLFASEARLASYVAIAKGDVPAEHWTRLGRPFARRAGGTVLLSWAGTMFEYLMPGLFLRTPVGSLSEVASRRAIRAQIAHAKGRRPWGVSESGFHQTDPHHRYRYRAFGVAELGVRWDPSDRDVTAPYASVLALSLEPRLVWRNLRRLEELGALGGLGFYEAVDFGRGGGRRPQLVRSYMAHHQGMILAALDNFLNDSVLVERFHRDRRTAAREYLLREAAPGRVRVQPARSLRRPPAERPALPPTLPTWDVEPTASPVPTTVVSNGGLGSLVTAVGSGGMRWRGRDVLRWRPDPTAHEWGTWIYVRDAESDALWSATAAPTWVVPRRYRVEFGAHAVQYQREDAGVAMRTNVFVVPGGDVEIRGVTLVNQSDRRKVLELTSYAEVALADPGEDRRHPAFSKLFVEGRYASRTGTLLLERRRRGEEDPLHLAHAVVSADPDQRPVSWQLDREAFIGRGGSLRRPRGARGLLASPPADEVWAPLDPIMSLTARVELPPGRTATIAFLTAVADAQGTAVAALDAYRSPHRTLFAADQARDRERALAHDLGLQAGDLPTFQRLLTALAFPYHELRTAAPERPERLPPLQELLWAVGVSGDGPVALLETTGEGDPLLAELVRAHAFWARHGVRFDLVVVGTAEDGYEQPLRGVLARLLDDLDLADRLGQRDGIHHVSYGRIAEPALAGLRAAASVALVADGRPLARHMERLEHRGSPLPTFVPVPPPETEEAEIAPVGRPDGLLFDNGVGGFTEDGGEYVIHLEPGQTTPAPWANVLAHERFGSLVTEAGGGYTWTDNSGERRLTTWRNDPIVDSPSEIVYLRDEETGAVWSATPSPASSGAAYSTRHRAGRTEFRHRSHGLTQLLTVRTPPPHCAKVVELTLENEWQRPRRVTVTYYAEWVLGVHRWSTGPHITTEASRPDRALFARNAFSPATSGLVAFLGSNEPIHAFTCDRYEFLGPEGDPARPHGLVRIGLEGRSGSFLDPCAALQVHVDLAAGGSHTVRFVLGAAEGVEEARGVLAGLRDPAAASRPDEGVATWNAFLGRVTVRTPEPAMDLLLNRWLPYQTVACRLWARTGLYQSSGAIGFRDQLQDSLALRWQAPALARSQILEAARHQFAEGDVLHWWHPADDRGVRTRCSDDLLWLPFAVVEYVDATGDRAVLDESVPFLEGPPLGPGEKERYDRFATGGPGTLYEHCVAALQRSSHRSPRGLPLIGTGDWNDALDRVGVEGRGESVWLAWFLYAVQTRFAEVCRERGDAGRADALREDAERLSASVEKHCWDGAWYQRATFDDGTPIGTAEARECRIDSLTQSWAVLSGGADPDRARLAMASVLRHLVRPEDRLVLLLTPPFHDMEPDPGYIRSYPPGVRENGGQYTHAAAWVGRAFAALGDGDRAEEIFRLLNPILRTAGAAGASAYRVEPYVLPGDVYGAPPHVGRGGWTWYTGSAGWLYRLGLEDVLGLRPVPEGVEIRPCVPSRWASYEVLVRAGPETTYRIVVRNPDGVHAGVVAASLDGAPLERPVVPLVDDGEAHEVDVVLGRTGGAGEAPAHAGRSAPEGEGG